MVGFQSIVGAQGCKHPSFYATLKKVIHMKTLQISISDLEFNKFGLEKDSLTFSEFVELITRELMRQNMDKCLTLAEKYGLSQMTMDEINEEVKAVRRAKNRS